MRVLLTSTHRYPAEDGQGSGIQPREEPSSAPAHINDLLARGLAELGHEVLYCLPDGCNQPLPRGVQWIVEPRFDVDILHDVPSANRPWVKTQHRKASAAEARDNWIFVSQALARVHEKTRYVHNGLDPADYCYSESKDDYFLYISGGQGNRIRYNYMAKGMDIALRLSAELGFRLIVAGTARQGFVVSRMMEMCRQYGVEFVGDVRGKRKAELFAGARALIFPTRQFEGMPLVLIEALMSGTPVISSDRGSCPEIITPEMGFTCHHKQQFVEAVSRIGTISPRKCRERAVQEFHYLRMAEAYAREYERELSGRD